MISHEFHSIKLSKHLYFNLVKYIFVRSTFGKNCNWSLLKTLNQFSSSILEMYEFNHFN